MSMYTCEDTKCNHHRHNEKKSFAFQRSSDTVGQFPTRKASKPPSSNLFLSASRFAPPWQKKKIKSKPPVMPASFYIFYAVNP